MDLVMIFYYIFKKYFFIKLKLQKGSGTGGAGI